MTIIIDPEFQKQLIQLVPVLAGGLIASLGGLTMHFLDRHNDSIKLRREKLECMLSHAYAIKSWTNRLDTYAAGLDKDDNQASPAEELEMLQRLYFPKLKAEVDLLVEASRKYRHALALLSSERLKIGKVPDNYVETIGTLYPPIRKAIDDLAIAAAKTTNTGL